MTNIFAGVRVAALAVKRLGGPRNEHPTVFPGVSIVSASRSLSAFPESF
jgi:hypothetical protein